LQLWLLPLGLLAYALMVFFGMRDPVLIDAARRPPPTPRPRLTSPTFRAQIEAIERTHQEITRSAAQSGGPLARLLLPIAEQGRELVEEAYILADKGQIIERYLASVDRRKLEQEVAAIDRQIQSTRGPVHPVATRRNAPGATGKNPECARPRHLYRSYQCTVAKYQRQPR
jgi:transposase